MTLRRLTATASRLPMLKRQPAHWAENAGPPGMRQRLLSSSRRSPARTRQTQEWALMGGAEHRPSMGGSSLGHLISELSSTKPGMEALRQEGQTILEEHRTLARNVAKWIMGVPVVIGTAIAGYTWMSERRSSDTD